MSAIPRLSAGVCCGVVSGMRNRCRILTYCQILCRFAMERNHISHLVSDQICSQKYTDPVLGPPL
jgi:hypothetical protein